ncbi:MAG TPA: flagellar protein FlgN [Anaerolineaceae bacterium]|nr:flagellar protein FlgN [Anaerolineaceae bacterium]
MQEYWIALEDYLVKEFRTLQTLINVTRSERAALCKGDSAVVLRVVEEKEAILDTLGLILDREKVTYQNIAQNVGLKSEAYSLRDLLPYIEPELQTRFKNLQEGISTLVEQAKELSTGNRALALAHSQCLDATQSFLLKLIMPPSNYQSPGLAHTMLPPVWGIEHAA